MSRRRAASRWDHRVILPSEVSADYPDGQSGPVITRPMTPEDYARMERTPSAVPRLSGEQVAALQADIRARTLTAAELAAHYAIPPALVSAHITRVQAQDAARPPTDTPVPVADDPTPSRGEEDPMPRQLTDDQVRALHAGIRAGRSNADLAAEFGIPINLITAHRSRVQAQDRRAATDDAPSGKETPMAQRLNHAQVEALHAGIRAGRATADLAEEFGITGGLVGYHRAQVKEEDRRAAAPGETAPATVGALGVPSEEDAPPPTVTPLEGIGIPPVALPDRLTWLAVLDPDEERWRQVGRWVSACRARGIQIRQLTATWGDGDAAVQVDGSAVIAVPDFFDGRLTLEVSPVRTQEPEANA